MNTDRLLREVETRLAGLDATARAEVLDAVREEIARERRRVEPELTVEKAIALVEDPSARSWRTSRCRGDRRPSASGASASRRR